LSFAEQRSAINQLTLAQVRQAHVDFMGAQTCVACRPEEKHTLDIALVGEFELAPVITQLRAEFENWRAPKPYARIAELSYRAPPKLTLVNTPEQANGVLLGAMPIALQDTDRDYVLATLANYILGGSGLDSRVMERLRQKDGLSYGGGTSLTVSGQSTASLWQVFAIAAPENLQRSEKAVMEEMQRFTASGLTPEELSKAKTGIVQSKRVSWSDDGRLAQTLVTQLELKRDMHFSAELEQRMAAATLAQVNRYIKQNLAPQNWGFLLTGDQAKFKK
jgi:zinc protease